MSANQSGTKKIGVCITAGLVFGLTSVAVQYLFNGYPSIDAQLVSAASEINKMCPFMVDAETRMDSTMPQPGKRLHYFYTLVNANEGDFDAAMLVEEIRPRLRNLVRSSEDMQELRDMSVTFVYEYRDKSGTSLAQIEIGPSDYND